MIKYDLTNINKWYNGSRNIVKCYHGTTNAFDLTGGQAPTPPPTPTHDYVDLGLPSGTKWARMNVGAESETDTGLYFQWGDTQGYTASQCGSGEGQKYFGWADYKYGNGTSDPGYTGITKYNASDGKTVLEVSDDAARAAWGGGWRMPTADEFNELLNTSNCTNTLVTNYNGSGVNGLLFTSKANGKTLFFPDCGRCYNGRVTYVGIRGYYWSSSLYSGAVYDAYRLIFYSGKCSVNNDFRRYGFSVRPVLA